MTQLPHPLSHLVARSAVSTCTPQVCVRFIVRMPTPTVGLVSIAVPALSSHVPQIVSSRPGEQMVRIDTTRLIAAVADEQAGGNWAYLPLVHETVSQPLVAISREPAIALFGNRPQPATIAETDLRKEPNLPPLSPTVEHLASRLRHRRSSNTGLAGPGAVTRRPVTPFYRMGAVA